MAQESLIPQGLMTAALLHFEKNVPIEDCQLRTDLKDRLARVHHVYWLWVRNPYIDAFALFKQMDKDSTADRHSAWRKAQRDKALFDFVRDNVALSSRKQDEATVRAAANQVIRIGMETDNVNALTKGGKLLFDVAGLDKPESEQADMNKAHFLPPVVTTNAHEVDDTKINYDDKQSLAIMNKYGAYIDEKRKMIEDRVAVMEAGREADGTTIDSTD